MFFRRSFPYFHFTSVCLASAAALLGCNPEKDGISPDTGVISAEEGGGGAEWLESELTIGAGDDGWRPDSDVFMTCPWRPQVPPGDWDYTLNCGPTSLIMANACMAGGDPDADDIIALIVWMEANVDDYSAGAPDYNGDYTNTADLELTSEERFGISATRFDSWTLEDVYNELVGGHPVVVATYTQSGNDEPSDVMETGGVGHFMLMVGMNSTHVILHDPGRSLSSNGENRDFTIESFFQNWQANAGVTFDP